MIAIVGYGMGNVRSLVNAFEHVGAAVSVAERPEALADAERIVLPGVGAFPEAMERLRTRGFADALERARQAGKPILGICLGMQLLAERGTEFAVTEGLGWIRGTVERIGDGGGTLRLPHVGWNELQVRREDALLRGLPRERSCYFVHSFHLRAAEEADVSATVEYGAPLAAAVSRGHVFGMQFHPEKSQQAGLAILRNFAALPC